MHNLLTIDSSIKTKSRSGLDAKLAQLFNAAVYEKFEYGRETRFSKSLGKVIQQYGEIAIKSLRSIIFDKRTDSRIVGQALRWIGLVNDPATHLSRLWLLIEASKSKSLYICDGALMGLGFLGTEQAVFHIKYSVWSFEDRQPAPKALTVKHLEVLRNDDSGRLDAKKISDVFGLPVATIAGCIGKSRVAVDKTPDSIAMQTDLHDFERLACILLAITGSMKGLKIWLNSPNAEFEGNIPLDVLKLGQVKMLADWMDNNRK